MMTQTHMLVAATLFANPQRPTLHNAAILLGSFVPDLAVCGLFVWSKLAGIPERQLWREVYFSEPMLTYTAIGNSLPLYIVILLMGLFWLNRETQATQVGEYKDYASLATRSALGLFALAAITHLAGDFPVHVTDAHPHFWPFSDWRFHSSISYWDTRHHGGIFSLLEAAAAIVLSIVLYRRFKTKWVRALTVLAMIAYAAVPIYFSLKLG